MSGAWSDPRTPPKVPRPVPAPIAESPAVAALEARLAAVDESAHDSFVAAFLAAVGVTPLIEEAPDAREARILTFLYEDAAAEEVVLFVNRLTDERDLDRSRMHRVPGTGLWHLSYRLGSDWRGSYAFLPRHAGEAPAYGDGTDQIAVRRALDGGLPDPRNPRQQRSRSGGAQSIAELPDAPPQPWLERREGVARGALEEREAPERRRAWLYSPAGEPERPVPLLIVLDGEVWTGVQDLAATLDNLVADRIAAPLAAVLLDSGGRDRRWQDLDEAGDAVRYLGEELLPWARAELAARGVAVSPSARDIAVVGQSLGALTALWAVVRRSDAIGAAISQSASVWRTGILDALAGAELAGARVHIEVGSQEWVLSGPNERVAEAFERAGAATAFVRYNGGHDYACWRGGVADAIRTLFPAPTGD